MEPSLTPEDYLEMSSAMDGAAREARQQAEHAPPARRRLLTEQALDFERCADFLTRAARSVPAQAVRLLERVDAIGPRTASRAARIAALAAGEALREACGP
ncbi:hypothetical protein SCMU_18400 [Sinomonas cyclohexanicum]|uniref:Uncharacterized protein n=1 Tax=Sinomonas cyclohexanicum TaxID=322009 RepID=A0ABN6FJH1_SINCY|nr:hypothetical protein [Corynebacterium cyclohexanicum]BCT75998.1 hypothetical protein SCMU_18400 [Corynebacterium cyclohexanicum]